MSPDLGIYCKKCQLKEYKTLLCPCCSCSYCDTTLFPLPAEMSISSQYINCSWTLSNHWMFTHSPVPGQTSHASKSSSVKTITGVAGKMHCGILQSLSSSLVSLLLSLTCARFTFQTGLDYEHLLCTVHGLSQFWPYIKESLTSVGIVSKAPVQKHRQRTSASRFRKRFMFVSKVGKVKEVKVSWLQ